MDSELPFICKICGKNRQGKGDGSCHHKLSPQKIGYDGQVTDIELNEKRLAVDCRHFTCDINGKAAAFDALDNGELATFYVGKNKTPIQAAVFGSAEKPTDKDMLRIVTPSGDVYSKQDGFYYPTGQNINNSNRR